MELYVILECRKDSEIKGGTLNPNSANAALASYLGEQGREEH
jgi:hypothetical protein